MTDGQSGRGSPQPEIPATEFPDLVQRYKVTGVPKTVVDDQVEILGAQPEEVFVQQALQTAE